MSLKKKDSVQPTGGLRVAADDPHLVSLGGGRLSTAVTIHNLPIGEYGSQNRARVGWERDDCIYSVRFLLV